jgi:Xaa-Pro dipeptidase
MTQSRLSQLEKLINQNQLDALVLNPSSSLVYLTGLHFHLMERPTVIVIKPGQTPVIILPELEKIKISQAAIPLQAFTFSDNPESWQQVFNESLQSLDLAGKTIGVESTSLRFLELEYLQKAMPSARFVSANKALENFRLCKDKNEIACIQKAVLIAQQALLATIPVIKKGTTELVIASELTSQLLRAGSDTALPFYPIVSSGPNSANPHAIPTERKLQQGDLLVIDWGASYHGYISDLTRTFAIEKPAPEYKKIAEIVREANAAARRLIQPGETVGSIDLAARNIIEHSGYGQFFTHRTGHGIGMDSHEVPYIFKENQTVLQKGMCFTVEPGIYLPNRGGVRIEDNVVVTENGCLTFSDLPRELKILE